MANKVYILIKKYLRIKPCKKYHEAILRLKKIECILVEENVN